MSMLNLALFFLESAFQFIAKPTLFLASISLFVQLFFLALILLMKYWSIVIGTFYLNLVTYITNHKTEII